MAVFVEVAKTGGFRKAAEVLGVPISMVSRRIAELEQGTGIRLLKRSTRRIELTEAGQIYYERCRRIVEEAQQANDELSGFNEKPSGVIRASLPVDLTIEYFSSIIADFSLKNPDLQFELDISPRNVNLVNEPFDFAVRFGLPSEPNMLVRKIGEMRPRIYASPKYLARRGTPTRPTDLESHECLLFKVNHWTFSPREGGPEVRVPLTGKVVSNNPSLALRLAVADCGLTISFEVLARKYVNSGQLVPLFPDWVINTLPIYVITETRLVPLRARIFIDFLITRLAEQSLDVA